MAPLGGERFRRAETVLEPNAVAQAGLDDHPVGRVGTVGHRVQVDDGIAQRCGPVKVALLAD